MACIGFLLNGAGLAVASTATLAGVIAGAALIGIGLPMVLVAELTSLQRRTPADLQGRAISASEAIINTPFAIAIAVGAGLIGVVGYRPIYIGRRPDLPRSGSRCCRTSGSPGLPGPRRAARGPGRGGLTSSAVGMRAADLLRQTQSPVTGLYRRHPERNLGTVAAAIVSAYRETGPVEAWTVAAWW